ncbi:MAG: hypothetical protein JSV78_10430 [Phycisphaerales bacterium]|nr:MAG: hypothetical protein JSV78_10430 [Phycisphaerales bacterium]
MTEQQEQHTPESLQDSLEQTRSAAEDRPTERRSWLRRLALMVVIVAVLVVSVLVWADRFINVPRMSDAEFAERLEQAMKRGNQWVARNRGRLLGKERNIALFYMLQRMDELHDSPAFRDMVDEFLRTPFSPAYSFWLKMLDADVHASSYRMNQALAGQSFDNRWTIYALDPQHVRLAPEEVRGLFDPNEREEYELTHQFWPLWHLRRLWQDPRVSDELLTTLCRRIADEAAHDIRITDLSTERLAFLLLADHPEMVRRRWIERQIDNQQADGGWADCWYTLGTSLHYAGDPESNEHTTLLALLALYHVKYKYAEHFGLPAAQAEIKNGS